MRDAIARLENITPKVNYSLSDMILTELDDLRQDLDRYGYKPLRLYEASFDCYVDLQHRIDAGELLADDQLGRFCRQLERSATDVFASDPHVGATVKQGASVRFDRLGSEERQKLADLMAAAIAEAKPDLSVVLTENLKDANAETVSYKAPDKDRYMLIGRLIGMMRLKHSEMVKVSEDSVKVGNVMALVGVY